MFALFNPPKNRARAKCSCAGYRFGKGKKSKKSKRARSPWIKHLKSFRKEHPLLTVSQAAKFAAQSYKPTPKRVGGYSKLTPEQRLAELELEGMAVPKSLRKVVEGRKARCDTWRTYGRYRGGKMITRPGWCGSEGVRVPPPKPARTGGWSGLRSASELRTPSGARMFAVAANRGRTSMARKRSHRGRRRGLRILGYNVGSMVPSMHAPTASASFADAVKPGKVAKNVMGVAPIVGGVIANSMLTSYLAGVIPMTKKGVGNYALGLAGAGIIGGLGALINSDVGKGALIGGVVETLGRVVRDVREKGLSALSLGDLGDDYSDPAWGFQGLGSGQSVPAEDLSGLNDFVTPGAIQRAFPSESTMTQYSLPAASAPVRAHEAYQQKVLAEVISDGDAGM